LTLLFIRWNEPDTLVLASLFIVYVVFTAIVIHAYWQGEPWARWLLLIRCVFILASFKLLAIEGGIRWAQGVTKRVLALTLLVYLNTAAIRAWFGTKRASS
jgi:hypothetical protein